MSAGDQAVDEPVGQEAGYERLAAGVGADQVAGPGAAGVSARSIVAATFSGGMPRAAAPRATCWYVAM